MNLVDRVNRERSLTAISRPLRFGRIVANTSVPTTTYSYDANGNLTVGAGWGYIWDYLNHMLAAGFGGSTTTYAYDAFGSRVMQTSTTSTTYYPNKFYSFSSMLSGGTTYATSTNYIWNGDTLLATIDQKLINGTATGTPITRYIHPDHLGSTNVVTDQNGNPVQLMDYYPYGATRVATSTYPTNEKRQYIDQFSDAQTGLDYLNARYYNSTQGQFLSEDPVFWGDPKQQNLLDPQTFNLYSYANDNPIVRKDPTGLIAGWDDIIAMGIGGTVNLTAYALATKLTGQPLSRGDAISAFAAGAVVAEGIDNAPETGGTSILAAARIAANLGGRAALTGEVSKQLAGLTTGDQKTIDYKAIALSPLKGYIGGAILGVTVPDVCIPGLSCGSNNWNGIGLQMGTKYGQGLISQVSISTSFKAAVGSQTKSFGNTFTGAVLTASASRNQPTQSSGNAMSTWLGYFNPFTSH